MPHHLNLQKNSLDKILLVGAGEMARAYSRVLDHLGVTYDTVTRSQQSAQKFKQDTGHAAYPGGVKEYGEQNSLPQTAIVAVSLDQLTPVSLLLIQMGVKRLLVEKPGGLNLDQLNRLSNAAEKAGASVYVAYNRRFYSSTIEAHRLIQMDGGATSLTFNFTELSHQIAGLHHPPVVKEAWLLANSTHVIDLAFFLAGEPVTMTAYTAGSLTWHPWAAQFCGAGLTERGVPFSYHADWEAPGRWRLEVMTKVRRLVFSPLETLSQQLQGQFDIEKVCLNDWYDARFKPGVWRQVVAFLDERTEGLLTIEQQRQRYKQVYQPMIKGVTRG